MYLTQSVGFVIFSSTLLSLVQIINAQQPSELIADLSSKINASTILYHCDTDSLLCDQLMRAQNGPKLRLTTNHKLKLRGFCHTSIMTIVILKQRSATELHNLLGLAETLRGRQSAHLLFIDEQQLALLNNRRYPTLNSWRWLFDWCWSNGYLNVLLLNAAPTTHRNAMTLLTYNPFPSLSVEYTTVTGYLQSRREPTNLQGLVLRTGFGHNPPRAVLYQDRQGAQMIKGMAPELVRLFAWRYNATLEFVRVVPANELYMALLCIEMLAARQLDICADFFINNDMVPTSQPVFLYKGYLLVRYPQPIDSYLYLFKPFSRSVWCVLVATFIFAIIFTTVIGRLQFGVWYIEYFLLEIISSLLQTSLKLIFIRGRIQRFLLILFSLCGFVISSIYLTCLSSLLTTQVFERQIESFEDLRDRNIPILVTQEDVALAKFYSIPPIVQELFKITPLSTIYEVQNVHDPRYAQLMFYDKCMLILYRQRFLLRPRVMNLDSPAEIISAGIPMKQNWPFQQLFDLHMLQMFDYGFHTHVLNMALEDATQHGNFSTFKTEYREVTPLNMAYFEMPALLLGCGYAMAFGSFLCELTLHRLKRYLKNQVFLTHGDRGVD